VKYDKAAATRIPTVGCEIVDEFKEAIKTKLELKGPVALFELFIEKADSPVRPGHSLQDAFYDPEATSWFGISDENPLIVKTIPVVAAPIAQGNT
jgi:hypothetical protein